MRLEKQRRNALFDAVKSTDLDPRECSMSNDEEGVRIMHEASGSGFVVSGTSSGRYVVSWLVGDRPVQSSMDVPWSTVIERCAVWAAETKVDAETPDLWAELQRGQEAASLTAEVENTPFTADERTQIADELRQIKEYVRESDTLSEAAWAALEQRLDDLEEASGRVGRKDWLLIFYGTMFSLAVDRVLTPDVLRSVVEMAAHGLANLFGGGLPQLPI